ncbi:MAG: hypothetical protein PF689_06780 [Deltaproteobacteria bacterium]|jgi:hypothetical protein|nr:hypothetical protein [Deltaproteobacteria bacterium]
MVSNNLKKLLQPLQISYYFVYAGFLSTVPIYFGITWVIKSSLKGEIFPFYLLYLVALLGIISPLTAFFFKHSFLLENSIKKTLSIIKSKDQLLQMTFFKNSSREVQNSLKNLELNDLQKLVVYRKILPSYLIIWSLCEFSAICGLVFMIMGGKIQYSMLFMLYSFLNLLFYFPSFKNISKEIDQVKHK